MTSSLCALNLLTSLIFLIGNRATAGLTPNDLKGCNGPFDIVLLLDSSVSLRDSDPYDRPLQTWNMMKTFAKTFVETLPADKNINVAVVRYSNQAEVIQAITSRQGYAGNGLDSLSFVGQNTNTAAALASAKTLLTSSGRRRIVLLMTDGLSTVDIDAAFDRAKELKDAGIEVYSLGISSYIDSAGLAIIASSPQSKYLIRLIGQAQLDNIVDIVVSRVCELPDPTPKPIPPCTTVAHCKCCISDSRKCDIGCCENRYYLEGWNCGECPDHCSNCTSQQNCQVCDIGYFKDPTTGKCIACSKGIFDLTFLIDSSGSIRDKNPKGPDGVVLYDNYLLILEFVQQVIDGLPIGKDLTRVAVITFSNTAKTFFYLNGLNYDRDAIRRAVGVSPYEGAFTNISGALRVARTDVFQARNGDRADVLNVAILVTDGESTKDKELTIPEAQQLRGQGTRIIAVGVTNEINRNELYQIVSPPFERHFFYSDLISGLRDNVLQALSNALCSDT